MAPRFLKDRCDGLLDETSPDRPRNVNDDRVADVIERTLRTTPVDATHWSIRSMAVETGFFHTIRRIRAAFGLQLHHNQSDPLFVDKVRDIVDLYLSLPKNLVHVHCNEGGGSRRVSLKAPNVDPLVAQLSLLQAPAPQPASSVKKRNKSGAQ